jgi:hypothetical protein
MSHIIWLLCYYSRFHSKAIYSSFPYWFFVTLISYNLLYSRNCNFIAIILLIIMYTYSKLWFVYLQLWQQLRPHILLRYKYLLYNRNCNFIAIILVLNNEVIIFVDSKKKKISLYYYLFEILAPHVPKFRIRPCTNVIRFNIILPDTYFKNLIVRL